MQEMIEPDRTILIVSVIGLIVIWGSVAYHKFVQDSAPVIDDEDGAPQEQPVTSDQAAPAAAQKSPASKSKRRKKGAKGR